MTDAHKKESFVDAVPEGDNRTRKVCSECGHVIYENPKIIVGAVCVWGDQVLLCRRAIEPCIGLWTIPAGFLELNESSVEGAAREVMEEAGAAVEMGNLLGIYEIPKIGHLYTIFRAELTSTDVSPGPESQEVRLFPWDELPLDELAFPSVTWALEHYFDPPATLVHTAQWEEWEE